MESFEGMYSLVIVNYYMIVVAFDFFGTIKLYISVIAHMCV